MSRPDSLRKDVAIETIIRFVKSLDPAPIWSEWYVGTAQFITERLYKDHKASYSKSFHVTVESSATARSVEKYFISQYGMDGQPNKADSPRCVYVFKKLRDTDPPLR